MGLLKRNRSPDLTIPGQVTGYGQASQLERLMEELRLLCSGLCPRLPMNSAWWNSARSRFDGRHFAGRLD
jgi:hypothetical protein